MSEKPQECGTGRAKNAKSLENLKPPFTPKEAREQGKKGGKASGKARAERKRFADYMEDLLNEKITVTLTKTQAEGGGEYQVKMTRKRYMALQLVNKTLKGIQDSTKLSRTDLKAFEEIRNTIGEKPVDRLEAVFDMPQEADLNKIKKWRAERLKK